MEWRDVFHVGHEEGSDEELRECLESCRKTVLQLRPVKGSLAEFDKAVWALVIEYANQTDTTILFDPPYNKDKRKIREALIMWATWQARRKVDEKQPPQRPPGRIPSVLCLVIPAKACPIVRKPSGDLSRSECELIANVWTWYWSGTERDFQGQGINSLFGPNQETAIEDDDALVCLKLSLPSTISGLSMSAGFGERYDAIRTLDKQGVCLDAVTEPISSALVLKLPLRQNR